MRQLVNFAYYNLTHQMNDLQKAEFDAALAGPEEREKVIAQQNMRSMQQLGQYGLRPPRPPRGDDASR